MPKHVCNTAQLKCSMGMTPSALIVLPANKVMTTNQPAANIMDNKPMVNIMPFGMCKSLANPAVASATAAALGTLTPQPCTPTIPAPWAPGSKDVMLANQPALNDTSKLACAFAGVIEISKPGQTKENIS